MKSLPAKYIHPVSQRGMTLVELMIAITLGLILTAGMIQLVVSSKQTYRVEESLARLQESARLALEFMSNDIRMTSYWGCQWDPTQITNDLDKTAAGYVDYTGVPLTGVDGGSSTAPDTLTIRGADGATALPLRPNLGGQFDILTTANPWVSATNNLSVGDIVVISNCKKGDIFKITSINNGALGHATGMGSSPQNSTASFADSYKDDASVYPIRTVVYSIKTGADGQPALWRNLNGADQELVSDVTNLQVQYGEDTNNDGSVDRYVDAGTVANFQKVYGVRITLTLQTGDANTSLTAGARISRVFSTTVSIRNRVL